MLQDALRYADPILEQWMPIPNPPPVGDELNFVFTVLPEYMVNHPHPQELLNHIWREVYQKAIEAVTDIIVGRQEHFVVQFIPTIERNDFNMRFRVRYEIMVCPTRDVVLPTFIYDQGGKIIEWRCGYCKSPNPKERRHCTQCGAPRAKLVQEL